MTERTPPKIYSRIHKLFGRPSVQGGRSTVRTTTLAVDRDIETVRTLTLAIHRRTITVRTITPAVHCDKRTVHLSFLTVQFKHYAHNELH